MLPYRTFHVAWRGSTFVSPAAIGESSYSIIIRSSIFRGYTNIAVTEGHRIVYLPNGPWWQERLYRANYGRKWHLERMEHSYIQLPAQPNGDLDWEFIERYIKTLPFSSQNPVRDGVCRQSQSLFVRSTLGLWRFYSPGMLFSVLLLYLKRC